MSAGDALSTFAQVAMAFTGFAGLLTVFRHRKDWTRVELAAVRYLLLLGVSASLFALIPMVMLTSGLSDAVTWELCVPALGIWLLLLAVWYQRIRLRELIRPRSPVAYWLMQTIGFVASLLSIAAAFVPELRQPGVYLTALFWMVLTGVVQFIVQVLKTLPPLNDD